MTACFRFSRAILWLMLALALVKAEARSLRVTSSQVVAGQNASVAVELASDGDENAMGFSLAFSPAIVEFLGWTHGSDAAGATVVQNTSQISLGRIGFLIALPVGESFQSGNRQLLVLRFRGVGQGQTSSVTFSDTPVAREISSADALVLSTIYQPGSIVVSSPLPTLPKISLNIVDAEAGESGRNPGTVRFARTGGTDSSLALAVSVSGSATAGEDYEAIVPPLIIPAGFDHLDIAVVPIDDSIVEGPETVMIGIVGSPDYAFEGSSASVITIQDDDGVVQGTPPVIFQHPADQTVSEGGSFSMQVGATGTPPLAFQWYRDGQLLPGRDDGILMLTSVTSNDAGVYTVKVQNEFGTVTSGSARLLVQPRPPAIVRQPAGQEAAEGSDVLFSVEASGTAPLVYQWRKDGQALEGATSPTLFLNAVMALQAGVYTVEVRNLGGSVLSDPARLTVQPKPISGTPPVISSIARQVYRNDVSVAHVLFTVHDAEDPSDSLILSATATPAGFLAESAFTFLGTGSNRWLTVTLPVRQSGQAQITVIARDSEGLEGRASFELVLEEVPPTPEITGIPDQVMSENHPAVTLPFLIADQDTPVGQLSVSVQSSDPVLFPGDRLQLSGRGHEWTLRLQPAIDRSGTAVITVTVTDGVQTASTDFEVRVTHINELPTITSLSDVEIEAGAFPPMVSFTVADAETPAAELRVTVDSSNRDLLPAANIFMGTQGDQRTLTFLPTPGKSGSTVITVRVVDADGAAVSAVFALEVRAPAPRLQAVTAAGEVVITWPADGEVYVLEMSRDLDPQSWMQIECPLNKGLEVVECRAPITGSSAFWRLRRR